MAGHLATPSTQTVYPWRTAIRTFVQTVIPAVIGLALILPAIVDTALAGIGSVLPDGWAAWLTGVAVSIAALAALVARVMAMPAVVAWTERFLPWLAPSKTD
ncbi:hypothetical protein [Sinomonas soli]